MDNLMEFIAILYFSKKSPKSKIVANHATNYSYKNSSFCIINYFETSSTILL